MFLDANLMTLAAKAPDSPTVLERLKKNLRTSERGSENWGRTAENNVLKARLANLTAAQAKSLLGEWFERDTSTVQERRAALAQIVDRIDLDAAGGQGRIHYRLGFGGTRFKLDALRRG